MPSAMPPHCVPPTMRGDRSRQRQGHGIAAGTRRKVGARTTSAPSQLRQQPAPQRTDRAVRGHPGRARVYRHRHREITDVSWGWGKGPRPRPRSWAASSRPITVAAHGGRLHRSRRDDHRTRRRRHRRSAPERPPSQGAASASSSTRCPDWGGPPRTTSDSTSPSRSRHVDFPHSATTRSAWSSTPRS